MGHRPVKSTHQENSSVNATDRQKARRGATMGHRPVSPPVVRSSQSSSRLHLLLFLLLLASSGLSYDTGDFVQCRLAHFVPGYNLLGESLDAATYERKGVHPVDIYTAMSPFWTCSLFRNIHQANQLQKVPYSVGLWTSETGCETTVRGVGHSSVSSVLKTVKSQDIYDWKVPLHVKVAGLDVGGQHYDSYNFIRSINREDQFTFSTHWHRCSFYRLAVREKPLLNQDFKDDVKNLPRYYNSSTKEQYRQFIRKYGTHYISQVHLGGQIKRLAGTRTCLSRMNGISTSEAQRCLSQDLEVRMGIGRLDSSCSKFLYNSGMKGYYSAGLYVERTRAIGGNGWRGVVSSNYPDSQGYRQWKESLKQNPVIVDFDKRPLSDLVKYKTKSELTDAINEYIREKEVRFSDSSHHSCSLSSHYSDCCPKYLGKGLLKVTIVRGWDLYGDVTTVTDGYVKLSYGLRCHKTRVIESNNPQWDETFHLGLVDAGHTLTLELKDEDLTRVELLASCAWAVKVGSYILTCKGYYGNFQASCELDCGPHLTGNNCDIYTHTEQ